MQSVIQSSYHLNHTQIFYQHAGAGASSTSVGPLQGNWLVAHIADLTPDLLRVNRREFPLMAVVSISFFHVSLTFPGPRLPSICGSLASDGIKLNMMWMDKVKIYKIKIK